MVRLGMAESSIELVQEKVGNPLEFSKVLKSAFQSRGNDVYKLIVSHLYVLFAVLLEFPSHYISFFFIFSLFPFNV